MRNSNTTDDGRDLDSRGDTGEAARAPSAALDRLGAVASGMCAAHCAMCALLPGVIGAVGLGAFLSHAAEWAFTLVAIGFASFALLLGWRRHRSARVASVLGAGAMGLLLARFVEEGGGHLLGTALGVIAGVVLVVGHLSNIRATRCCPAECV